MTAQQRLDVNPIPSDGTIPQLFLDCDGVLADFDAGARDVLGMSSASFEHRHGKREFWRRISLAPDFYARLPLMADACATVRRSGASEADHPHRPAARQLGGAAKSPLGRGAFPGHADHHLPGARQIPAHERCRRAGRRSLRPSGKMGRRRRHFRPPQGRENQPGSARPNLSVRENPQLRPRRRYRPSRPTPARTPARGSTSPVQLPRFR